MIKVSNILDGWKNFIDKSEVAEKLASERAEKCSKCENAIKSNLLFFKDSLKEIQGYKCNKCQCPLSAKVRSKNEKCPIDKW